MGGIQRSQTLGWLLNPDQERWWSVDISRDLGWCVLKDRVLVQGPV